MKNPHAVALGTLGGLAKSEKKTAAIKRNLKKARALRWPKKARLTKRSVTSSVPDKEEHP